jgi:hypothetical protein
MKEEKKIKRNFFELEVNVATKIGKSNPCIEKRKLKVVDLMGIVRIKLKSCKVEIIKLKTKEKELASKVSEVKMVLDSM